MIKPFDYRTSIVLEVDEPLSLHTFSPALHRDYSFPNGRSA